MSQSDRPHLVLIPGLLCTADLLWRRSRRSPLRLHQRRRPHARAAWPRSPAASSRRRRPASRSPGCRWAAIRPGRGQASARAEAAGAARHQRARRPAGAIGAAPTAHRARKGAWALRRAGEAYAASCRRHEPETPASRCPWRWRRRRGLQPSSGRRPRSWAGRTTADAGRDRLPDARCGRGGGHHHAGQGGRGDGARHPQEPSRDHPRLRPPLYTRAARKR